MRIGVMTGGGDCQGLNAAIQAIVRKATEYGFEVYGVSRGYKGLIEGDLKQLSLGDVEGIFHVGGTILGTSRINPFKTKEGIERVKENFKKFGLDALIIIGGGDTLGVANKLYDMGIPIIGVPKTIDNDLLETDYCLGFQTAVEIAADAITRLHTTAKSHDRVVIVEIMGRYSGWLTLMAGLAGGAHIILIPEEPFDIESICKVIEEREKKGKTYTIIAVAEGAKPENLGDFITVTREKDDFGHVRLGGIARVLEKEISKRTGKSTRSVILGHVQRGGPPNSYDRILGIRLGLSAVELAKEGMFGYATVLKGTEIVSVKLGKVVEKMRAVDKELIKLTKFYLPM